MHDLITLIQVLVPLATGLATLWLSNKKSDRDYLKDENRELSARNKILTDRVDKLTEENENLRKELFKNDN